MLSNSHVIGLIISVIAVSVSAQLSFNIPTSGGGIPITGQSLAVLCVLFLLPNWHGVFAIGLYILLGVLGLPVYADGTSGFDKLIGNSGGYLYGFFIASIILTVLFPKRETTLNTILGFMTLGTTLIVLSGTLHLSISYGLSKAIEYGVTPFLPGALVKVLLGTIIVYFTRMIMNRIA
jgi:biotin transport system substrate-specific component